MKGSLDITASDFFCGAGGSTTGMISIPGVRVSAASNHWDKAIETHQYNHQHTEHILADLSQITPKLFPRTTIGWFSPECTWHSNARGAKRLAAQISLLSDDLPSEAAERSRATMWDVVRFTEYHRYELVFVENVVEIYSWPLYRPWIAAMHALGYEHRLICLNSMHSWTFGTPAPQSRDRVYVCFWKAGNRAPDFETVVRPPATCSRCGPVRALQAWKNPGVAVGKYRSQYSYRCPARACADTVLEPDWLPASTIIDWTKTGQRIGDRTRPLKPKTIARIQAGIDRYWAAPNAEDAREAAGTLFEYRQASPRPSEGRAPVFEPFVSVLRGQSKNHRTSEALSTVSAGGRHHAVITPFIAELRGGGSTARSVSDALCTVTASGNHHGLVVPAAAHHRKSTRRPIAVEDLFFRMLDVPELKGAMGFPSSYVLRGGTKQRDVRMCGNAVTPPTSRDLVGIGIRSLEADRS
nr:DNA cytosine methyltransferase [uncultured Rhodococcus sp.]